LKGKFLQHKRNWQLDHLLYILTEKTIPYFIARHRWQDFGFEGPDLELRHYLEIEERAKAITKASIEPAKDGDSYQVPSQSEPGFWYHVNLDAYTCDCDGFHLISFCKHLSAVQTHFPPPFSAITSLPTGGPDLPDVDAPTKPASVTANDSHDLIQIGRKLLELSSHGQTLPHPDMDALLAIELNLDRALTKQGSISALPTMVKVAPNQHSWSETAAVMGVKPKTKRKRHEDLYSGGQQSGKKAKADARAPKKK
jgi:hypothetical protein